MDSTTLPLSISRNATSEVVFKSIPKPIAIPPVADDITEDDVIIDDSNPPENHNSMSSTYMMIFLPIVAVLLIVALAAAIRWRNRINHAHHTNGKCHKSVNNNDSSKTEGDIFQSAEEASPLKARRTSASSSRSSVSRDILVEGSRPVSLNMRVVDTTDAVISRSSRTDSYGRVGSPAGPESLTIECEILKEKKTEFSLEENRKKAADTEQFMQENKPEATFPKRPKTLQVVAIIDDNKTTTNTDSSKGFPWAEQQWTPDAEIIYEDTGSPENACGIQKEGQDCLFPLMAKGRFKMKPKGLLERRGSNVALTISLNNEGKMCTSPPPSSKSPKPLVYLRTATAKLDPVQLHIKAADTSRLQQEFWDIPMNHPSEKHFSIPGYGTKNRYRSILPNPHSRVLLPASPGGDPLSAYINANYVRGCTATPVVSEVERRRQSEDGKENEDRRMSMKRKAGFIATQGPMANTIVDFWKMVWQENSTSIVMITKLKERKEKCTEYLPAGLGERRTYDQFEVETVNVKYADHYTVRTLAVRNSEEKDVVHTVVHFWYAEWLDHETPDRLRSLLTLVQEVDARCPDTPTADHGPVVVHCSAGIGRTGCFIAIHIGCQQLRAEGKVDPLKIICQLRMDRGGMIQTWEQYQYVHVALSRYARILAGENCNTPLTGSSMQTPDSRGSSRHSTPSSGGGSEFKNPQNSRLLFSPKIYTKPDLTTVVESTVVESETATGVNANPKSPPKNNDAWPVLSPRLADSSQNSRFSFLCAGDTSQNPGNLVPSCAACPAVGVEAYRDASSSKRTKKSTPPPPLSLKLIPVQDEDWLVDGQREVAGRDQNDTSIKVVEPCQASGSASRGKATSVTLTASTTYDFDNVDLGKLENILSPTARELSQAITDEQVQSSSTFTFPTAEK